MRLARNPRVLLFQPQSDFLAFVLDEAGKFLVGPRVSEIGLVEGLDVPLRRRMRGLLPLFHLLFLLSLGLFCLALCLFLHPNHGLPLLVELLLSLFFLLLLENPLLLQLPLVFEHDLLLADEFHPPSAFFFELLFALARKLHHDAF